MAGLSCGNDPVNNSDPLGLKVFYRVNSNDKTITLYFFIRYKTTYPIIGEGSRRKALAALAKKHKDAFEKTFNDQNMVYGAENAPLADDENNYLGSGKWGQKAKVKYKGYTIKAKVEITTDEEPADSGADLYDTVDIVWGPWKSLRANSGAYSSVESDETVFHEWMHLANCHDEYDEDRPGGNPAVLFEKAWGYKPGTRGDAGSVMLSGDRTKVLGRHIEAALFDINNTTREAIGNACDKTFELDPRASYWKAFDKRTGAGTIYLENVVPFEKVKALCDKLDREPVPRTSK